jgi:hypothetical protein
MACLPFTDSKFSLYRMMLKIINFLSGLMKLENWVTLKIMELVLVMEERQG